MRLCQVEGHLGCAGGQVTVVLGGDDSEVTDSVQDGLFSGCHEGLSGRIGGMGSERDSRKQQQLIRVDNVVNLDDLPVRAPSGRRAAAWA